MGCAVQNGLTSICSKTAKGIRNITVRFEQLTPGKLMGNCLRAGFCFLPVVFVVSDEVRGGRIAEFIQEILRQDFRLTDIGIISGLVAAGVVVLVWGNVAGLLLNTGKEPLGAVPDCTEFTVVKRRHTFGGLLKKALVCRFRVPVFFDDLSCEAGHGCVSAAFRDHLRSMPVRKIRVKVITLQVFRQVHNPVEDLDVRLCCAEEEAGGIQGLRIEEWEDRIDQLFQITVSIGIRDRADWEQHMELRPCGSSVFLLHVMTAVVDGKTNTGKVRRHIFRCHPESRIFAVVVITVNRQAVRTQVVRPVAVAVFVFRADIIVSDSLFQRIRIDNLKAVRIQAVAWTADVI